MEIRRYSDMKITPKMLQAAKGEHPAELVFKNGQVLNLFTRELLPADVAVCLLYTSFCNSSRAVRFPSKSYGSAAFYSVF